MNLALISSYSLSTATTSWVPSSTTSLTVLDSSKLGLLGQIAHSVAIGPDDVALVGFIETGDDLHDRGLTRTVGSDDANLGTVVKGQVDVLEDVFSGRGRFVDLDHRKNDLFVVAHGLDLALER